MSKLKVILPLLVLLLLAIAGVVMREAGQGGAELATASCDNLLHGCRIPFRGNNLDVRFSTAPSPLAPFELKLAAPFVKQAYAELAMVGMDMDANRYRLTPSPDGVWRAEVTLPVCASGRRDWLLTLELDGSRIQIPFATEK